MPFFRFPYQAITRSSAVAVIANRIAYDVRYLQTDGWNSGGQHE